MAPHKHLQGIIKILKGRLNYLNINAAKSVTPAENKVEIQKLLADFLPPSFGVGSGTVIAKDGNNSKPIDIIIYHKYHKPANTSHQDAETYPLSRVVFIIEVNLTYNEDSLTKALDNIKSVKELKPSETSYSETEQNTKKKKPDANLPYGIIWFDKIANESKATERERFFVSLKTKLEGYEVAHRPDCLFSLGHSASYINPVLRGESASEYDIGISIEPELKKPSRCYVCHKKFTQQHFFYPRLCVKCGDFNYAKRKQTANLEGLTALVTGARVKIGYEGAWRLLRDGARVIATTRFPHDAARRYSQEDDFNKWRDRLHIYGVDFRHIPSVEHFIEHLKRVYTKLDILINNAAQTIRRPPAFYAHLMAFESVPISELPREIQPLLNSYLPADKRMLLDGAESVNPVTDLELAVPRAIRGISWGMNLSAVLSQVPLLPEDGERDVNLFPPEEYDGDRQQIDKRTTNSWNLKLDEVSTIEVVEVFLINAIVPFLIASQLKPLMMRSPAKSKYIINVSAQEGNFNYLNKNSCHPHTNMAKAAANMMTRTSARDYARDNIFINSVDPGWISNENPYQIAAEMSAQGFQAPLDALDAAARICDPIYVGINSGKNECGKLIKDYVVSEW